MKVVVGIDSGVNGGVCVLYPDKAACAAPVGSITELRPTGAKSSNVCTRANVAFCAIRCC